METRLVYVADPLCSWCYGFSPVLEQIRVESGLSVDVLVGGLRPGPDARPMDPAMLVHLTQAWDRVADVTGQPFGRAQLGWDGWMYDTEMPNRAVVAVRTLNPSLTLPFFSKIQDAFYRDGVDVTKPNQLAKLASSVGVDGVTLSDALGSDQNRAATYAEFQMVREMGISGFPALLAARGDKARALTLGYQSADRVRPALEEALAFFDEAVDLA